MRLRNLRARATCSGRAGNVQLHFHDDPDVVSRSGVSVASVIVVPFTRTARGIGAGKAGNPVAGQQRLLARVTSSGHGPAEAAELPAPAAALRARIRVIGPGGYFRLYLCFVHAPDAGQETRYVARCVLGVT
jgi:hypothetical protein